MIIHRSSLPARFLLFAAAVAAAGQNVYVASGPGVAPAAVAGYSERLEFFSSVTPAGSPVIQILPSPGGERVFVVAGDPANPVQLVTVAGGRFVAGAIVPLDGMTPVAAALSPDGARLAVLATGAGGVGMLFILDAATATVVPGGRVSLDPNPTAVVISQTSRHAFVLRGPRMHAVDLMTGSATVVNLPVAGERLSVTPFGSIMVSARFLITEYDARPPFRELGRISTGFNPSEISVTPDGRFGITILRDGHTSSLELYDFNLKTVDLGRSAGSPLRRVPIPVVVGGLVDPFAVIVPDQVFAVSATRAIGVSAARGHLYTIELPSLVVRELWLGAAAGPPPFSAIAVSAEHPVARNLYVLNTAGVLSRYDLIASLTAETAATPGAAGIVFHRSRAGVAGAPAALSALNLNQTVNAGALLRPYVVKLVDAEGRPVFGQTVTFSAPAGVTFTPAMAATNIDGVTTVDVTAPAVGGTFTVRATVGALTLDMTSTVAGVVGGGPIASPQLVKVTGDGTLLGAGLGFRTLTLRVVDPQGRPMPNTPVTWSRTEGIGLNADLTVTDERGEVSVFVIPPGFLPGTAPFATHEVTAATAFGSTSFRILVFPPQGGGFSTRPVPHVLKPEDLRFNYDLRLGVVMPEAIQISLVSQGGVVSGIPIPGVSISAHTFIGYDDLERPIFNLDRDRGPVLRCDGDSNSNAQGVATCNLVAEGRPGTLPLWIDVGNGERAWTGMVTVTPGPPGAPQMAFGDAQTGRVGETLPVALQARTTDGFGNILTGVTVVWEVVTRDSVTLLDTVSVSNAQGLVSTRVRLGTLPGTFQVRLRVGERAITYTMTALPVASALVKVSGDGQTEGFVNEAFARPLVVQARDAQGRAVPNVAVVWAVTGGATLSATQSTTDASGNAQVTVTAGAVPGPITVTASSAGLGPPVAFDLRSRLRGPVVAATGFRNLASGETGVAPGALVMISGRGMAPGIVGVLTAEVRGRLPFELNGTTVVFQSGGVDFPAPVYQIGAVMGEEYAVVQTPFEIPTGPLSAVIRVRGAETVVSGITRLEVSPGILEDTYSGGRRAAIVIRGDGRLVTPATPARRGETVRMFAVGLGQTTPAASTNTMGIPDQRVNATVAVGIDDAGVQVLSAHMAQNLVGIYEIVFVVPAWATLGDNRPLGLVMEVTPGQPVWAQGSIIAVGEN
jgi:uncharacterized protein (TIGR03437 family)